MDRKPRAFPLKPNTGDEALDWLIDNDPDMTALSQFAYTRKHGILTPARECKIAMTERSLDALMDEGAEAA